MHIFLSQRETLQPLQAATFVCTTSEIMLVAGFYWEPWYSKTQCIKTYIFPSQSEEILYM